MRCGIALRRGKTLNQERVKGGDVPGKSLTSGGAYDRETLHDFSIDYVKVLAEVFGWSVKEARGPRRGPDLIVEDAVNGKVEAPRNAPRNLKYRFNLMGCREDQVA
jgi:hypothetical protein